MLSYFRSKEKTVFDKLGFKLDQNGILKRYLRESEAWAPHLKKTKEVILNQSETKLKNKVAILGSGWLLDIPIVELASQFTEVWLFDVRHPSQVKQQVSKLENVKMIETDISGLALPIYDLVNQKHQPKNAIEHLTPGFNFNLSEFDFVVSCNLMNQLDIFLLDYILEHIRLSHEDETTLRHLIQQTHLNLLPPEKSCLITDIEEIWINKKDEITGQKQLIFTKFPDNSIFDEWIWHFDNHYNYHNHCKTWLKVVASRI